MISDGLLSFEPSLDAFQVQPHAVDLRLGNIFYVPQTWTMTKHGRTIFNINYAKNLPEEHWQKVELTKGQYFEIAPGEMVLATTLEKVVLNAPNVMGVLYPRSSVNRRGLSVDMTGIIDVRYQGTLMIPIVNNTSAQIITVYPGERICQVVFERVEEEISEEEAMMHGRGRAKYAGSSSTSIMPKMDLDEEMRLVRLGDTESIKANYKF